MSDTVVAAVIGAGAGIIGLVATQVAAVYTQHVRTLKVEFLERQLRDAYAPIDFWLSVLVDLRCDEDSRSQAKEALRRVVLLHGYLLTPTLRSDLYRLIVGQGTTDDAADAYLAFNDKYEVMVSAYWRDHFASSSEVPITNVRRLASNFGNVWK